MQFYMMPKKMVNKDFYKMLFKGDKRLFKLKGVSYIIVPKLDELSVSNILNAMKDDA